MIELKLSAKRYSCILRLRGKYNIVGGNGGTGKTTLTEAIRLLARNGKLNVDGYNIYSEALVPLTEMTYLMSIEQQSVFVIDECSILIRTNKYLKELLKSKNYFIITSRDGFNRIPYGVFDVFDMVGVPTRCEMVPRYTVQFLRRSAIRLSPGSRVVCEGSGLDAMLIKSKLASADIEVVSAAGKDKIKSVFTDVQKSHVVLLCDWCGTAGATGALLSLLRNSGEVATIFSPSFEYELLGNTWVCGRDGAFLREEYTANALDFVSAEDYFAACASACISSTVGLSYSKSSSSKLAELLASGKTVVNSKVISGEPQPVKMDWLYPELQVANLRTVNKLKLD